MVRQPPPESLWALLDAVTFRKSAMKSEEGAIANCVGVKCKGMPWFK